MASGQPGRATKLRLLASVITRRTLSKQRSANATASIPPRDQPTSTQRDGRHSSMRCRTASRSKPGTGALAPKPGKSTTITSANACRTGTRGCQLWLSQPQPCNSTKGSPEWEPRAGYRYLAKGMSMEFPATASVVGSVTGQISQSIQQLRHLLLCMLCREGNAQPGTARRHCGRTDRNHQKPALGQPLGQCQRPRLVTHQ